MGIKTSDLNARREVGDLSDIGDVLLTTFGEYRQLILRDLFENLMETTPERTGTLRFNWRFKPGSKAGSFLSDNDGTDKPFPREPADKDYITKAKNFTIYNNSPYIMIVNNGEGGNSANQNFIQRALAMTDARF